jgi:hypothetical protein
MAATFKPYPFNPVDFPAEARLRIEAGTPVVDVESPDQLNRAVHSGYTAHCEGDRGHAFGWQERGRFRVVNWQQEEDGPARMIVFLNLEDAAEYMLMCVR